MKEPILLKKYSDIECIANEHFIFPALLFNSNVQYSSVKVSELYSSVALCLSLPSSPHLLLLSQTVSVYFHYKALDVSICDCIET